MPVYSIWIVSFRGKWEHGSHRAPLKRNLSGTSAEQAPSSPTLALGYRNIYLCFNPRLRTGGDKEPKQATKA